MELSAPTFSNEMLEASNNFFSNSMKLRASLKNLIVTFNAIQKVYKSRFDDGRSNMNYNLMANTYLNYPLLMGDRSPYESLLRKNKQFFFTPNLVTTYFKPRLQKIYTSLTPSNYTLFDIPFMLSLKSDASRYL
jgi:hypothetical protein